MSQPKRHWPLRQRVEVEWRDSAAHGGWDSVEGYKRRRHVGPIRSIGYVLSDSDGMLTLAQSQSASNQDISDCVTIPREAVVRIKRLSRGIR